MSTDEVRAALIGCGGVARHYRHRYAQIPGVRLAAVIDIDPELAENTARELGAERWSTDFSEALKGDIHAAVISTPNHLHAEQATAVLKAGKHLLLQKPIARTVAEAETIVETAKQAEVKSGVYMSMRENPLFQDIKQLVSTGHLGEVTSVYCRGGGRGGLNAKPSWRTSLEKTGGGAFIQKTIHFVNLAQWILKDRIVSVSAYSKNLLCTAIGGDDTTTAACEFRSGRLGTLEASYCADPHIFALYGTKGFVTVTNTVKLDIKLDSSFEGEIIRYEKPGQLLSETFDVSMAALGRKENPHDQHAAYMNAVLSGGPVPVPLTEGLQDMKVVEAVYKSARENKPADIAE